MQISRKKSWALIPLCAALLCLMQLLLSFPGQLVFDSQQALDQALSRQYGDWHPPIMALVWTYLIRISGTYGSLLVLQQILHWLGFGLIADGCMRCGMVKRAWVILIAGVFPYFVMFDKILLKDVGMGSAFVAAFGLVFWFLIQDRRPPWWVYVLSGACLLYGGLIRANAPVALGALLYIFVTRGRRFHAVKIVVCSVVVAAIAIPVSSLINHRVIAARSQDPLQSLQIFDLMGIAARSGDNRVWGEQAPELNAIRSCYTAYWWDTFSAWGVCSALRTQIGASPDIDTVDKAQVQRRSELWRRAILEHPLAYAAHRLRHFNSSIYFLVPALPLRYAQANWLERPFTAHDIRLDYVKRGFPYWPVFWLAVGLCGALLLTVQERRPVTGAVAKSLMVSGLLYSAAYLPLGVATEYRYHYWSIMAILIGVILSADQIAALFSKPLWRGRLAAAVVLLVIVGGYAARIADLQLF